jgi:hypothetical protein
MKMLTLAACELGSGVVTTRRPFLSVEISHEGVVGPLRRRLVDVITETFAA